MKTIIVAAALALAGCANFGGNPAAMSADQLNALSKDKNASLTCSKVIAAGVTATLVLVNVDEITRVNSSATVSADCVATVTNLSAIPAPAAPTPASVPVVVPK